MFHAPFALRYLRRRADSPSARSASGPDPGSSRTLCRVRAAATCIRYPKRNAKRRSTRDAAEYGNAGDHRPGTRQRVMPVPWEVSDGGNPIQDGLRWHSAGNRYATLGLSGLSATVCLRGFLSRDPCHCRRVCLHWHWVAGTSRSVPGGQRCAAVGRLCASEPTDKAATTPAQTQVSVPRFRYGDRDRAGSRDTRRSSVAHPGGHSYQRFTQSGSGVMSSLGRLPGSGRPDPSRRF